MKKSLWMLAMAVAALTSCTQSEVVDIPQSRLIAFDSHVDKQTRATNDITDGSTDFIQFHVYGAKGNKSESGFTSDNTTDTDFYLHNQSVTGGKGNWTYNPHKPWIANKTFRFAAYADGKESGTSTTAIDENQITFITNDTDNKWGLDINNYAVGNNDLIMAIPQEVSVGDNVAATAPTTVGLTFKHALAKVIFQFFYTASSSNTSALKLEIEPFSFKAAGKGDCSSRFTGEETNNVIGIVWKNNTYNETENSKQYGFFPKIIDTDGTTQINQSWSSGNIQCEAYVIPQSNEGITIDQITIYSKNSVGEKTSETTFKNVSLKIANHIEWKPGYVYRYAADITPGEHHIHFTSSVNSWIDENNLNQTITGGTTTTNTDNN